MNVSLAFWAVSIILSNSDNDTEKLRPSIWNSPAAISLYLLLKLNSSLPENEKRGSMHIIGYTFSGLWYIIFHRSIEFGYTNMINKKKNL